MTSSFLIKLIKAGSFLFILSSAFIYYKLQTIPRQLIPDHLKGHPVHFYEDIIDKETSIELKKYLKELGSDGIGFPANSNQKGLSEVHIGEIEPVMSNGQCSIPVLLKDQSGQNCIIPSRMDVGRDFGKTGGVQGLKETHQQIYNRVNSFGRYMYDLQSYPLIEQLINSEKFQNSAKSVCPPDKQYIDPFQFNIINQVPGQTVAAHVDALYFWGANGFHFPLWFLSVMHLSGLFQDIFIHQVQQIIYLHDWDDPTGEFIYWQDSDKPQSILPLPNSGVVSDGTKTIHATGIFRPEKQPPSLSVNSKNQVLKYIENENWELLEDNTLLESFKTSDLRMTLVYRSRCFSSEQEAIDYKANNIDTNKDILSLEYILDVLVKDMVSKKILEKGKDYKSFSRLELAKLLLDNYINYPMASKQTAIIPFNYCIISKFNRNPHLKQIFKVFEDIFCNQDHLQKQDL